MGGANPLRKGFTLASLSAASSVTTETGPVGNGVYTACAVELGYDSGRCEAEVEVE